MREFEKKNEPLLRIVKRAALPWWKAWLVRISAVAAALVACSVITVLMTGENPLDIFESMLKASIGNFDQEGYALFEQRRFWAMLQEVAILLCVSLAVTPAFKMRYWNIGAEGQVLMGALSTAACMILIGRDMPQPMLIVTMLVTAVVSGAIWAVIPALFKARWGTNETLFTLMMNYIAIQIVSFFTYEWSVPKGSGQIGVINAKDRYGWLPELFGQKYMFNILIVVLVTVLMFIYLRYSKQGYELTVVGESENTARYIGINVRKVIVRTLLLSGALCGLAGFLLVAGTDHTVASTTAGGRGFTAIMVSWLGKFNPLFMIATSLLIVVLQRGAGEVASTVGINTAFSEILTGIIIFFIIGSEFFINYAVKFRRKEKGGAAV